MIKCPTCKSDGYDVQEDETVYENPLSDDELRLFCVCDECCQRFFVVYTYYRIEEEDEAED